VPEVEFGQRQVANSVRERLSGFLADNDSRRSKTVELKDAVPDEMVQRVQEEAADSRQAEADEAGQASLSDRERKDIDFSREGVNVPFARSVKGIAQNEGVSDWLQFADFELTVDENRRVLAEASNEERNRSDLGKSQEKRDIQRAADNKRKRRKQAEGAKQPAFEGDSDAADFLRDEQRFEDDLFDINLRSGSGPSGQDFERLQEAHNNRSERAQRVDERRSAEVTRDPLKWAQNKAKYDYPGIDTIQPAELHSERSRRARRTDEEEQAPIADSRQQWALNPDQYDWPGVDTKQRPSMADLKEQADEMKSARLDSMFRFESMSDDEELQAKASAADVSITPEEALEKQFSESTASFAGGPTYNAKVGQVVETDRIDQEQKPPEQALQEQQNSMPGDGGDSAVDGFVDDSDQQASLDIGIDAGATRDREGEIAGSANFADERDELQPDNDSGEQAGLLERTANVGGDDQADLLGGDATTTTGQEYLK